MKESPKNKKKNYKKKKKDSQSKSQNLNSTPSGRNTNSQSNQQKPRSITQNPPRKRKAFNAYKGVAYNCVKINYDDFSQDNYQNLNEPKDPKGVSTSRNKTPRNNFKLNNRKTSSFVPHKGLGFTTTDSQDEGGQKKSWLEPVIFVKSTLPEDLLLMKILKLSSSGTSNELQATQDCVDEILPAEAISKDLFQQSGNIDDTTVRTDNNSFSNTEDSPTVGIRTSLKYLELEKMEINPPGKIEYDNSGDVNEILSASSLISEKKVSFSSECEDQITEEVENLHNETSPTGSNSERSDRSLQSLEENGNGTSGDVSNEVQQQQTSHWFVDTKGDNESTTQSTSEVEDPKGVSDSQTLGSKHLPIQIEDSSENDNTTESPNLNSYSNPNNQESSVSNAWFIDTTGSLIVENDTEEYEAINNMQELDEEVIVFEGRSLSSTQKQYISIKEATQLVDEGNQNKSIKMKRKKKGRRKGKRKGNSKHSSAAFLDISGTEDEEAMADFMENTSGHNAEEMEAIAKMKLLESEDPFEYIDEEIGYISEQDQDSELEFSDSSLSSKEDLTLDSEEEAKGNFNGQFQWDQCIEEDLPVFNQEDKEDLIIEGKFEELLKGKKKNSKAERKLKLREQIRNELIRKELIEGKSPAPSPDEFQQFVNLWKYHGQMLALAKSNTRTMLQLPVITDNKARAALHRIAAYYRMKSQSTGKGVFRSPAIYKTQYTNVSTKATKKAASVIQRYQNECSMRKRLVGFGVRDQKSNKKSQKNGSTTKSSKLAPGTVVGHKAKPISDDNIGHRMMLGMGWKPGASLGLSGQGIVDPLQAVFKYDRLGLGH